MSQRINWTVKSLEEKHRRGNMFIYLNSGPKCPTGSTGKWKHPVNKKIQETGERSGAGGLFFLQ